MKSNAVYEIENRLKEAFSPTYLMIEESTSDLDAVPPT